MPDLDHLLAEYAAGPETLRRSIVNVRVNDLDAVPCEGNWSIRQVICHLSDSELVYADRIKRVIAEDNPSFFDADPDLFSAALCWSARDIEDELQLITLTRRQILRILQNCPVETFPRTGVHSTDGAMTLETLVERITEHIPHHIHFIEQKVSAL
ncbi:MAG: hypothetical protein GY758_02845 [Fuerstiella sp.]|nr:hypothetical protein [Fuerstiella sp.]